MTGSARSRMPRLTGITALAGALVYAVVACQPRAAPLAGAPAPRAATLPNVGLGTTPRRVTFTWRYDEQDGASARGEGVARITPPDSAQLQFFLAGGFAAGTARLAGDRLELPNRDEFRRFLPAAPLLWAAFGRLAVPPASDTTLRQSGDTLRADVGRAPTWRVMIVRDTLRGVERIENGRVVERVVRENASVVYRHEAERRSLRIELLRDVSLSAP